MDLWPNLLLKWLYGTPKIFQYLLLYVHC
jgi:hypothetical protein